MKLADGKFIDKYVMEGLISKGGFGAVNLCTNITTQEKYAVKIMEMNDGLLKYLKEELEINTKMANIKASHVLYSIDSYVENPFIYIVMKYCNSDNLEKYCAGKPMMEAAVRYFLKQILIGLLEIHSQNCIHRDIKPANIMLDKINNAYKTWEWGKYRAYISDLGFATNRLKACTVLGTPICMAPEVHNQNGYSSKADIWSLGITASYMLFGKFYYSFTPPGTTTPPTKLNLGKGRILSLACLSFLECCLQLNPNDRSDASTLLKHQFFNLDFTHPWMLPSTELVQQDGVTCINPLQKEYTNRMNSAKVPYISTPINATIKSLLYRFNAELNKL
jgi:serine/threonine protein kinase